MTATITDARLQELTTVATGTHGGVLIDAAFVRDLAAELLAARAKIAYRDEQLRELVAIHARIDERRARDDDGAAVMLHAKELLCRGAERERDALQAILAGRTAPPTDEEIAAHDAAGGRWRCVVPQALVMCADALHGHAARWHRATVAAAGWESVWWALDADHCVTAWPTVEAAQ